MKQLCLLFFFLPFLQYASAQEVAKKQILAGESGDDEVTAGIIRTTDGGYLVGGYSFSLPGNNKKAPNYGSADYWIIKYDKSGKKQYDRTFGGNDYEILYSLLQTTDGGYMLAGSSSSGISGVKTEASEGNSDMWLVKTDSLGNKLWDKTYGGNDYEDLNGIAPTADGGYILCGTSYSNISGNKTENSFGSGDYWVIKIDAQGNMQWQKTFGGDKYDVATNVAQTTDGGYFIAGHSSSGRNGNKTTNTRGSDDIWIVRTDNLGNKLWDKTIGGNSIDATVTMQPTTDGGFIIGANSASGISGDKTEASKGSIDYWLVKVTADGITQWQKVVGGADADYITGVKQTSDGGYILLGFSLSQISGDKTEDRRGQDFDNWVVKLSADRTVEWDKTIGGFVNDQAGLNSIIERNSSQYILASTSNSPADGDKTVPNRGNFDIWFTGIQYDALAFNHKVAITPLSSLASSAFTITPNPVKEVMHVKVEGKTTLTLSNAEGKLFLTKIINGKEDISVSHLPAGTYYVKNITTGEIKKIIIVK